MENKREIIHKVMDLALDRTERGHHTFAHYSPHVNEFTVDVHNGVWRNSDPWFSVIFHFSGVYEGKAEVIGKTNGFEIVTISFEDAYTLLEMDEVDMNRLTVRKINNLIKENKKHD